MMNNNKNIAITDVTLCEGSASLLSSRLHLKEILPIATELDNSGYWSLEVLNSEIFHDCLQYFGEDPWERLRELKKAMPKTPLQIALQGQQLFGTRYYANDVIDLFIERAIANGISIFRIFDAMNDIRNLRHPLIAARQNGAHVQGTLCYTTSPAHTLNTWLNLTEQLLEIGIDSLVIKDTAGILTPMAAYELIKAIKQHFEIKLHLHCNATTAVAGITLFKAIEAGIDGIDTTNFAMQNNYAPPAIAPLIVVLQNTPFQTDLKLNYLEKVANYLQTVRPNTPNYETTIIGNHYALLNSQIPFPMQTAIKTQLAKHNAVEQFDAVLQESTNIRKDLGYIPLISPFTQIVTTQAIDNIFTGDRYQTITNEIAAIVKGNYGATPDSVSSELKAKVFKDQLPSTITHPIETLAPEMEVLTRETLQQAKAKNIQLKADGTDDDILLIALAPESGWHFLQNRNNPSVFKKEVASKTSTTLAEHSIKTSTQEIYTVELEGKSFVVKVSNGGEIDTITPISSPTIPLSHSPTPPQTISKDTNTQATTVTAPMAGAVVKILVKQNQTVAQGDVLLILEAMKMEIQICAETSGTIQTIHANVGDTVAADDTLITII
ncbi:pyruvate carboxylase subunit B [Gallibacterium trehalosifermentans]|uniref:Pyruvate carboxylase subunit B n=1 Tax=Gallibacterium trehalosifermentans TaxID=516935 RepID=A0ABV6H258_9PAST